MSTSPLPFRSPTVDVLPPADLSQSETIPNESDINGLFDSFFSLHLHFMLISLGLHFNTTLWYRVPQIPCWFGRVKHIAYKCDTAFGTAQGLLVRGYA